MQRHSDSTGFIVGKSSTAGANGGGKCQADRVRCLSHLSCLKGTSSPHKQLRSCDQSLHVILPAGGDFSSKKNCKSLWCYGTLQPLLKDGSICAAYEVSNVQLKKVETHMPLGEVRTSIIAQSGGYQILLMVPRMLRLAASMRIPLFHQGNPLLNCYGVHWCSN